MKITIPEVVKDFAEFYQKPGNGVWGNLHIVLEDGNVENSHVGWCLKNALEQKDYESARLCGFLLQMTRSQRSRLPRKVSEFICGRSGPCASWREC